MRLVENGTSPLAFRSGRQANNEHMTSPAEGAYERLLKLQSITDAALAHLSLDNLLDELLERIRAALDADTCAVLLLDEETNELVPRAAKGLEEEVARGVRIPFGRGFAGRVAAERRPVVVEDLNHVDVVNPLLREKGIRSLLGVPLIAQDRMLGVVHVGTLTRREFTPDDVDLLELVAQRLTAAMERTLVHEELVRLEELERMFVSLASHELRTPASVVFGIAATLHERGDELSEEQLDDLRAGLYEQSFRLKRLVEQLLDLSRLRARAIEIRPEPVQAREMVDEIVRALGEEDAEGVEIAVEPELEVIADRVALDRILSNLIGNAVRYGEPPVVVGLEPSDRHVRFYVEDRGRGVDPNFVPELFERFRRSESSRKQAGGAGLGLAIARMYARSHGGELIYSPAEPRGARFELVLPK